MRYAINPSLAFSNDVHTVRLDFETDDPTDDLMATMSDGRRCFISAKREVGNDRHLKDTVVGWVGQMGDIRDGDLLVLAAEELKGVVKDLAEALRRRRDGRDSAGKHRDAIAAVTKHVPAALVDDLLDRVRVLHIPSATGASQTRTLLESMAGYLVEDGNGGAVDSPFRSGPLTSLSSVEAITADWVRWYNSTSPLIHRLDQHPPAETEADYYHAPTRDDQPVVRT